MHKDPEAWTRLTATAGQVHKMHNYQFQRAGAATHEPPHLVIWRPAPVSFALHYRNDPFRKLH